MIKLYTLIFTTIILTSCASNNKKIVSEHNESKTTNKNIDFNKILQVNTLKFKAKEKCTEANKDLSKFTWQKTVNIANTCLYNKEYNQLISIANFLSNNYKNNPFGAYFKSYYFMSKNLNLKALWLIDSTIEKNSDVGLFHYQKAIILNKLKYTGAAKASAQKALTLNNNNFGGHLLLGQLELQAGNHKLALDHAKVAEKLFKNNLAVETLLADLFFITKDYKNAIIYLEKIKKSNSVKNEINFKLAYSFEELENKKMSILYYKKIEAIKKSNLLSVYGLDVNEKIKEMEVEVAKVYSKKRQPSNKKIKDGE